MDYIQELENVKTWAKNLLILQYHQAPRNKKLIELMTELLFANNLILKIRDLCLNIDESIGAQLDVVGKWVGIDRYYNSVDIWNHPYTALVDYSNVKDDEYLDWQGGFSTFSNFADNDGGFLTYKQWMNTRTQVNQMGDAYFRQLIKLKAIKNSIRFTNKNIDDAIWQWSNGTVYTTWDVMGVTYHYDGDAIWKAGTTEEISLKTLIQLAVYKNVLLAPSGCNIVIEEI